MRCVQAQYPVLAGVSALAIALAAGASVALAAEEPTAPPPKAQSSTDDYYTRRAKSILAAEKAGEAKPHPLAASFPGMDIVVCEAGCPEGSGAHVVFKRRHVVPTETQVGMMVPTSGRYDEASAVSSGSVACVAGCYDQTASVDAAPEPAAPAVGNWATTVNSSDLPPRDKLSPVR